MMLNKGQDVYLLSMRDLARRGVKDRLTCCRHAVPALLPLLPEMQVFLISRAVILSPLAPATSQPPAGCSQPPSSFKV